MSMGRFEQAFKGIKAGLIRKIDVSIQLLAELQDNDILTEEQFVSIRVKDKMSEKVEELRAILCKRPDSEFDKFCAALYNNNQQDVVDLMKSNLHKQTAPRELGTLCSSCSSYNRLQNPNIDELQEVIEPDYGLPDQLYVNGILERSQLEEILHHCESTFNQKQKRVRQLLQFVLQGMMTQQVNGSVLKVLGETPPFKDALVVTNQHHIVNYIAAGGITGNILSNDRPLTEQQRKRLHPCPILVEHSGMDSRNAELQIRLIQEKIISQRQLDDVNEQTSLIKMNTRLLLIMERRSLASVILFINHLRTIGQHKLVEQLVEPGAFVGLKTMISDSTMTIEDKRTLESLFIICWMTFFKLVYESCHLDGNYEAAVEACDRLNRVDCHLNDVEQSNSILWHIKCRRLESLESLWEMYLCGELIDCLQNIFNCLCGNKGRSPVQLSVEWNIEDYERCRIYMRETSGRPFGSLVEQTHHMVQSDCDSLSSPRRTHSDEDGTLKKKPLIDDSKLSDIGVLTTSEDIEKDITLPSEMIELILMKATVALFNTLRVRLLPNVNLESLTLTTMFSVCLEWWQVISYRTRNKRILRWWFREKSTAVPLELFKSLVMFRISLATEPSKPRDADIKTLLTFAAVCRHWWQSIKKNDDISRRQLKQMFRHRPQLLKVVPVLRSHLHFLDPLTYCNRMLFVVFYDKLKVFDGDSMKEITTFDLSKSMPRSFSSLVTDIVSCSDTMNLFVAEFYGNIFRVNISSINNINVNKFVHDEVNVKSMSLTRRRLLLTPMYNEDKVNSLVVYDVVSGERLQSVQLPTFMRATHSIESTNNVFIVSHWGKSRDHRGVSEVNSEGHVTRAYNGLLDNPYYLTLDSLGRILVLDRKWNVLLLSGELKYERVLVDMQQLVDKQTTEQTSGTLISSLSSLPSSIPSLPRMCYVKKTRRLFVSVRYNEKQIDDEIIILKC